MVVEREVTAENRIVPDPIAVFALVARLSVSTGSIPGLVGASPC